MMERDKIFQFIFNELIGPDPKDNVEEVLLNEPPRLRYSAGVLFPKTAQIKMADVSSEEESQMTLQNEEEIIDEKAAIENNNNIPDSSEDIEEEIVLANSHFPSAMGITCIMQIPDNDVIVKVNAAKYEKREVNHRTSYYRVPLDQPLMFTKSEIPFKSGTSIEKNLVYKGKNEKLKINIRNRSHVGLNLKGAHLLTFTLINDNNSGTIIRNEDCYFQVSFSIQSLNSCFKPFIQKNSVVEHDDEKSNQLLFRNKKIFATGHGCTPSWDDAAVDSISILNAHAITSYEIKPILPTSFDDLQFGMYEFAENDISESLENIIRMNDYYAKWIQEQENQIQFLEEDLKQIAYHHISKCKECLQRMIDGVQLLQTDEIVQRAFQLMNKAMLLQQLRYSIDIRKWKLENKNVILENRELPVYSDKNTWKKGLGYWRPFQLAFILINLKCMRFNEDQNRLVVDLIWFPTGGGKTEAYLGLSAYTIFLKRLRKPDDTGTTILMRYTLRLLTAQQFQRAASLICACDSIRKENQIQLGNERITIGLWVGESLTPIYRKDALLKLKQMEDGTSDENSFLILKCPWCGAQMGKIQNCGNEKVKGYKRRNIGYNTVVFQCPNNDCEFSTNEFNLPLNVIDEDLYMNPTTLLIGTVDKFAMLPWRPEARTLFGFRNDLRITPPELIIQDELHLISGPLGSMVGLYETMIEELCTYNNIKPKIIASTATISRAREQINSLYGRGTDNVSVFPVQCLNYGDSFFAYEDKNAVGRKYVSIFTSALPSHATAQVRVMSSLLQSVKSVEVNSEINRDPYWTCMVYFNSIRELGHAATLIRADIREYMNAMWLRKGIAGDERRFINNDIELTSRVNSGEIAEYLEMLLKSYNGKKNEYPVDVCLATNMISVGLDIPRLGLMAVVGQPKTTSEYIQATSRVGRSLTSPGIVFTIFNCSKPRDRSHYENFQAYHSRIYNKVEPTSVTPFSSPARDRALHAIAVGLVRLLSEKYSMSPAPFPDDEYINYIKEIILNRVKVIDPEEFENTELMLNDKLNFWKLNAPLEYGRFGKIINTPLMYVAGTNPNDDIKLRSLATPTSMRNVDATCCAKPVSNYIDFGEEDAS